MAGFIHDFRHNSRTKIERLNPCRADLRVCTAPKKGWHSG
jgi:hypothetical protein